MHSQWTSSTMSCYFARSLTTVRRDDDEAMHNHIIQHESSSYQLEQESKAHDQRVGWQEVLSTSDHEGPHCQILACRSSLGDLSSTQPLSVLVLLLPYTCLTNYNKETQQQHNLQPPCRTTTKAFCKVAANIAAAVSLHAMQTASYAPGDAIKHLL